jgi:double-stranded uracil-DNA glycosylase
MVSRAPSPAPPNDPSHLARSFPPVFAADALILILGSMPGRASLQAGQYYAHPHNAFWPIIETLLGISGPLGYGDRIRLLTRARIALWDVLGACIRNGSLDSSIMPSSILVNDFSIFFEAVPGIQAIFFNGSTAEREYTRRVIPRLPDRFAVLPTYRLPSTSPAMAGMTRIQKLEHWRRITDSLQSAA